MAYIDGNEIYFGIVGQVEGGGDIIGAAQQLQEQPKALAVSTFEIESSTTAALDFLAGIQPLWAWDDYSATSGSAYIDFGQLRFRQKGGTNRLYFSRMDSGTDYGSFDLAVGTVTVIKGDDVIMITAATTGGYMYNIVAGYMTDDTDTDTAYKCIFTAPRYSTTNVRVLGGVDISTEVLGFKSSTYYNDNWYRTTNRTDELAPLFLDDETLTFVANKILLVRACVDRQKTGLYAVGDTKVYYGYTLAIKDV